MADPMDANLILLIAVVSGILGGFLYKGLRSKQAGLAGSKLDPNPDLRSGGSIELPPGFVVNPHEKGWTVTSGPRLPFQASAEIPRVLSGAERGLVRVEVGLTLSEDLARLFAGPISGEWRWKGNAWEYELVVEGAQSGLYRALELDTLVEVARPRLAQAATLQRLTALATLFSAGDERAAMANPKAASPRELDRLGAKLVEHLGEAEPELSLRIATHLEAPPVWAALLAVRRFRNVATRQLIERWPRSAEAELAMTQAIAEPHALGEEVLAALFEALERKRDPRLAELLARIVDDVELLHRELVLTWVERCGDETALPGLGVLESRSAKQWQSRIEGARAAIAFRRQEVVDRLSGGLSVSVADGSLALSEDDR